MHPAGQSATYWGGHPGLPCHHIWVTDMVKHACRLITRGPQVHGHPAWWPDSRKLVYFVTQESGDQRPEAQFDVQRPPAHLYRHCLEGRETEQLTEGPFVDERPTVTPDGKAMIFVSNRAKTGLNLWALDGECGDLRQLTQGSTLDYRPLVAPDSEKIAYFTKGDARPALWLLDTAEGICTRLHIPGVDDSSHGIWDEAQSWLAFDSRQDWGFLAPAVAAFPSV